MATPDITSVILFGDADRGPRAGANYYIRIGAEDNADEAAAALWEYLKANYQDDWQEYRRSTVSTTEDGTKLVQVIVLTTWGDGHRSTF